MLEVVGDAKMTVFLHDGLQLVVEDIADHDVDLGVALEVGVRDDVPERVGAESPGSKFFGQTGACRSSEKGAGRRHLSTYLP